VTFAKNGFSDPVIWIACQSETRGHGLHRPPTWLPREIVGNEGTAPEIACQDHSEVTPFANPLSDH
jgi:hypothetical protein